MRIFAFSWRDYRAAFRRDGWVHVKDGVDPELLSHVQELLAANGLSEHQVGDEVSREEEQYLFDPPWRVDYQRDLFDVIASLTDLRRESMTLSERHVKLYRGNAAPSSPSLSSRCSPRVAVVLSIEVPPGSHLVLYRDRLQSADPPFPFGGRVSVEPEWAPEGRGGPERLEVHDAPGDVVVFPASSMRHSRTNATGSAGLVFEVNDLDTDPLGEDPSTPLRRSMTLAALSRPPGELGTVVPSLSRQFDSVVREWSRATVRTSRAALVWGSPPVQLSYAEDSLLRSLGGGRTLAAVAAQRPDIGEEVAEKALRRLAHRGVIDLLPAPAAT